MENTSRLLTPPPDLKVSEWADKYRQLSSESSAEPGNWNTDKAPYQREIMDALNDERVHTIVWMSSAQVGKTEGLLNSIGYLADQDPCPILLLQPTLSMAEAFSKDRLTPMFRDSPCLADKIAKEKAKGSDNTILQKKFPGGHLTMAGANSPASLASRPIRIVFCDEVDRYPASAGAEGDPIALAYKRTTTFWNRKLFLTSTPTIKHHSRIEASYDASDKRRFNVPCKHCGTLQTLKWAQIKFLPIAPEDAYYECEACGQALREKDKLPMLRAGQWIATAPFNGIAGFHLNELYSPWKKWAEVVADFLQAKQLPETLKVWVNTSLGESWEDPSESLEASTLLERCEVYDEVPAGAMVLTAGVDVQNDRLECEVVAWGDQYESWSIDYRVFHGDPGKPAIWNELDDYLRTPWTHESGLQLPIKTTCIDSGGSFTDNVYKFVKPRQNRGIFAVKGGSKPALPLLSKPSLNNKARVKLYILGVDTGKEMVYSRLKIKEPGPGYCHFTERVNDLTYFEGLTAEKVVTKFLHGFPRRVWQKAERDRNEPLDCRNYATAALEILKPNWVQMRKNFDARVKRQAVRPERPVPPPPPPMQKEAEIAEEHQALAEPAPPPKPKPKAQQRRQRTSFVNRWR